MGKHTWIVVLVCVVLLALIIMQCSETSRSNSRAPTTTKKPRESLASESSKAEGTSSSTPAEEVAADGGEQASSSSSDGANASGSGSAGKAEGSGGVPGESGAKAGGATNSSGAGSAGGAPGGSSAGTASNGGQSGSGAPGNPRQHGGHESHQSAATPSTGTGASPKNQGEAPASGSGSQSGWVDVVEDAPGGPIAIVYPKAPPVTQLPDMDALKLDAKDPRRELIGLWSQSSGPKEGDFAHGGYTQTTLAFTTAGRIEVTRFFGFVPAEGTLDASVLRKSVQLDYVVQGNSIVFSVPTDKRPPDQRALELVDAQGKLWRASAPQALPTTTAYSLQRDTLRIGAKAYKRIQPPSK